MGTGSAVSRASAVLCSSALVCVITIFDHKECAHLSSRRAGASAAAAAAASAATTGAAASASAAATAAGLPPKVSFRPSRANERPAAMLALGQSRLPL